jgi:hypothetical protein
MPAQPQPQQQPTPIADKFIQQISVLAQQMGIQNLVIAIEDPSNGVQKVVASKDGVDALRVAVGTKFQFSDGLGEAEWPASF